MKRKEWSQLCREASRLGYTVSSGMFAGIGGHLYPFMVTGPGLTVTCLNSINEVDAMISMLIVSANDPAILDSARKHAAKWDADTKRQAAQP